MKIPNLWIAYVKGEGSLNATISDKTGQRYLVSLAHNGSGVLGAKRLFLASMNCVKRFRNTFKGLSFQDLLWLQELGSCKASFGTKVV